jgi:hypothetical protein
MHFYIHISCLHSVGGLIVGGTGGTFGGITVFVVVVVVVVGIGGLFVGRKRADVAPVELTAGVERLESRS